ncbi:MAG: hypothetical protein V4682_01420 [Patescibacteria group bacterium]
MKTFVFRKADTGEELGRADSMDGVKQFLLDNSTLDEVVVGMSLDMPLHARVNRETDQYGVVILKIGDTERQFTRNTQFAPDGDLCVSCPPEGIEVPVMTINVPFREYENPAVCKGMVWISPGDDAEAHIQLFPPALKHANENVEQILTDAQKAVQENVLNRMAA